MKLGPKRGISSLKSVFCKLCQIWNFGSRIIAISTISVLKLVSTLKQVRKDSRIGLGLLKKIFFELCIKI